ncbi:MAG TPA: NAD(P)H-dependent oxidoreductase [Phenylobacterium sp.]
MTRPATVAVVVGSLRKDSFSRKVAEAIAELAPRNLTFRTVEIGDLPMFDQDLEPTPPAQWVRLREEVASADAVLFVTPEYNRSLPAVIKNAVDVGSRPYGHSAWNGKPGAVVSVSPGAIGGFGANHHLRQSLAFLNVPTLQREAYVGGAGALFDEQGKLVNEATKAFLTDYAAAFADWIEQVRPAPEAARTAA